MIYLDNAATSWPKPESVYVAMDRFMREVGASPGRSGHRLAVAAGRIVLETRERLAELFGVADPLRIVFTLNVTEALNLVIRGLLHDGDHVITSSMEHNSVMRPLRALEPAVEVSVVPCSTEGVLDPDAVAAAIRPNTKLVILNHASNVVGTLLPVAEVGAIARRRGIVFAVDAAQTAGAYPIDVEAINVDLLGFTGHKSLFGPQGTGGLFIRDGIELEPLKRGGTGSRSEFEVQPDFLPDCYESGTPNTVGLAGLGAGVAFVLKEGVADIRAHELALTRQLIDSLHSIDGVRVYGTGDAQRQVAVVSFTIDGVSPSDVAEWLDEDYEIMCRVGLHCAPRAHRTIGTFPQGTIRLSPGYFTTEADIARCVVAVAAIAARGRAAARFEAAAAGED